jgi:hypothetical protein
VEAHRTFSAHFFAALARDRRRLVDAKADAELRSLDRATETLRKFQHIDLEGLDAFSRLPSLEAFPKGSRYHLLIDCEVADPTKWLEVGWDGKTCGLGESRPLHLRPGDLILHRRQASGSMSSARDDSHWKASPSYALRLLEGLSDELVATDTGEYEGELKAAVRLLSLLLRADLSEVQWVHEVRYYQCGYHDMHVAAGGRAPLRWLEVLRDGSAGDLREARGRSRRLKLDVFSSDVVVRGS